MFDFEREMLRITLASIGDAVIVTDSAGRVTFMNAVARTLTGWQDDEAQGQPLENVFRIVNERTRRIVESPAVRALREGTIVGLANHTILIAKDGIEWSIDDSAAPIRNERGVVVGVVLVFRDVTERRKAEKAKRLLAAIVESSDDAIIGKDIHGVITSWNRGAERIFGYTAAEAIGRPIAMLAPPDRSDEMPAILARIQRGERIDHFDTLRRAKDGRLVPVSLTVSPIKDEGGVIIGASKIARDVTDRKQLDHERDERARELAVAFAKRTEEARRAEKAEALLREADKRKDEFLATLSHELRNPLAAIHYAVELLRRPDASAEVIGQASATMKRQVGQIVRLVDDLLDISRITTGKLHILKERVQLAEIFRNAVETTQPLIDLQGHELTVELPPEPIHLDADPIRLAQVVANLLHNAAKYTERSGRIWLRGERQADSVVISVRDAGIGIAPEHLPKLFEIFSQAAPALERSQSGLGIGLSLVRGLVRLHGGTIEARSEGLGRGSEFIVRLPGVEMLRHSGAFKTGPGAARSAPGRRILFVDDNRDAALTMAALLRMSGHDVQTAFDGVEAVQTAATFHPEIVLLDIGMPRMNGYDTAKQIRAEPWGKSMMLIALTGWGQEDDKRRAQEAGFNHHLTKPVSAAKIEKLLESIASGTKM